MGRAGSPEVYVFGNTSGAPGGSLPGGLRCLPRPEARGPFRLPPATHIREDNLFCSVQQTWDTVKDTRSAQHTTCRGSSGKISLRVFLCSSSKPRGVWFLSNTMPATVVLHPSGSHASCRTSIGNAVAGIRGTVLCVPRLADHDPCALCPLGRPYAELHCTRLAMVNLAGGHTPRICWAQNK